MRKINRVLIIALIIFIIILISIGGFIYAYLTTDILKSNQKLFFKYFSQVIDEENRFFDTRINSYFDKKEQSPYENIGNIRLNFQAPEEIISDDIIESVNQLNVNFSGKTNKTKKQAQQDIEVDFGQDMIIPISYRQSSQLYGLQSKYIGSKYIAVENNNLKDLAEKLGIDSSEIPDKIEIEKDYDKIIEFSQEEKNQIIENYQNILIEQTTKDNYSKTETLTGMNYTLTLSAEEVKELLIKFMETFKQDTMLMDKLNQYLNAIGSTNQITDEQIQDLIDELNKKDVSEFKELKITIGQQNKLLNKILIENETNRIELIKNVSNDSINYVIGIQNNQEEAQVQMSLSSTFSGITELENITENYNLKIGATIEDETISYNYVINNNVQFKDSVSIESLNDDTALFLNDCDTETLQNLMMAIQERIVSINSQITNNLGLEETENPLIYSNPITYLSAIIYNSAVDSIFSKAEEAQDKLNLQALEEEKKMEELQEKTESIVRQTHNDKFEIYTGQRRGSEVNALINTTLTNNLSETDDNRKVRITLDGSEILGINDKQMQRVDASKRYQVEAVYDDDTAYITEIRILTLN